MKEITVKMTINPLAAFFNLLVSIGILNIFIEKFRTSNFNISWILIAFAIYVLLSNFIRLLTSRKRLYILGNKLIFRTMFGFKKNLVFDTDIDITQLKLERQMNASNKSKLFLKQAFLACFNINYGCVLICHKRKIFSGADCSNQTMIRRPASKKMQPLLRNKYR